MWMLLTLLILIVIGIVVGLRFYLAHWAKYFVDAAVERRNHWYRDEGLPMIDPQAVERVPEYPPEVEDFWRRGEKWKLYNEENQKQVANFFTKASHQWVLLLHDYRSNGYQDLAQEAYGFHQRGFNVVVPDLRAHGESDGETIGLGWLDRLDLKLWLQKVCEADQEAEIVLYGASMGAATVLMVSGEKLPDNVKVLIADSSYTSVYSEFKFLLKRLTKYPVNRFMALANSYAKKRIGYSLIQASVTRQLGSNHLPVLFLHGGSDTLVPPEETQTLMEATAGEKELVLFPNCEHLQAKTIQKQQYWQVMEDFLKKYFYQK